MHRTALGSALLTAIVFVAACASTGGSRPGPVNTSARAMIYGHIEAPPKTVTSITLARPLSIYRPTVPVNDHGDFVFNDLVPGDFALLGFEADGKGYLLVNRDRESNKRFIVKTVAGGMHYAGSWRVTGEKSNRFTPDEFSIERMDVPPRVVFERLRPTLAGSGWEHKKPGG